MRKSSILAAGLLAATLAACGSDDSATNSSGSGESAGEQLTIYSSLPLQGAARAQSEAAVNGAKLALEQAGAKAGKFPIKYVSLDDSTAQAAGWEPNATSTNARPASSVSSAEERRRVRAIVQIVLTALLLPLALYVVFGPGSFGSAARDAASALLGAIVTFWLKD